MRGNGLLKWLMLPMLLLLVFVGIKLFSGKRDNHENNAAPAKSVTTLTPAEMKTLGIDGDTPRDTVATLVAQVKQLRNELQTALTDNKNQKTENERLRQRESAIDQRIQSALDSERGRLQHDRDQLSNDRQQTQTLLQDLQQRFDALHDNTHRSTDLPGGLGLDDGDGQSVENGVRWIEPSRKAGAAKTDKTAASDKNFNFPDFEKPQSSGDSVEDAAVDANHSANGTATAQPVYTVPANATLLGSIAMTALIGRVPVDGTVNDPYPFKVVIGRDNLTANGIDIPDVAGAIASGTASGDWTLSCVRGHIRSITFVFQDGTIRTLPDTHRPDSGGSDITAQQNPNTSVTQGGLGWISDPYGIPCVGGERRSNAEQYLGSQALITAAGAGAASLVPSTTGSVAVVGNSNGSLGTVGITGNEAMGRILANGMQDLSQWVNKLYGQAFAAVYVQPGAPVAVHIERQLRIDYELSGRRVNHRAGGSHASTLD